MSESTTFSDPSGRSLLPLVNIYIYIHEYHLELRQQILTIIMTYIQERVHTDRPCLKDLN